VLEHLTKVSRFASNADRYQQLRLGAVIDRDFREEDAVATLEADGKVHVLTCRMEENIFLQPEAVKELMRRQDDERSYEELLLEVTDECAGYWLSRYANERIPNELQARFNKAPMTSGNANKWKSIGSDREAWISMVIAAQSLEENAAEMLEKVLVTSAQAYDDLRTSPDLWRWCYGKSVIGPFCKKLRINDEVFERAIMRLWIDDVVPWPEPVMRFRDWLHGLQPMSAK
jgi:hypothetical protein